MDASQIIPCPRCAASPAPTACPLCGDSRQIEELADGTLRGAPLTPLQRIQALLFQMDLPLEILTPEADLRRDLALDTRDLLDLFVSIEDSCGAVLIYEDLRSLRSLGDLAALVAARLEDAHKNSNCCPQCGARPPWSWLCEPFGCKNFGLNRGGQP